MTRPRVSAATIREHLALVQPGDAGVLHVARVLGVSQWLVRRTASQQPGAGRPRKERCVCLCCGHKHVSSKKPEAIP